MRTYDLKAIIKAALRVACLVPFAAVAAFGQQVNLTAAPATAPLPDGSAVPMWGYTCTGPTVIASSTATCAALNPSAGVGMWSPVLITVPTGQPLTINLTNNLPSPVPTSLTIVGQIGGGLGSARTTTPAPMHDNQPVTWSTANAAGGVFTPPPQGPRVQSFATEVAPGATTALTWNLLKPGTYLIESGTHPSIQGPMGLYGILVVTCPPGSAACTTPGTAYSVGGTGTPVTYSAEVPLLLSEIDPAQNNAVNTAVSTTGFSESSTLGPFLGVAVASVKLTSGGSGYTGFTSTNNTFVVAINGSGGSGATATATVDTNPASSTYQQVISLALNNPGSGYTTAPPVSLAVGTYTTPATAVSALLLQPNAIAHCSGGAAACYPPAVNYTPLYYTINGVAFNKTNAPGSLFAATPGTVAAPVSGNVLVRFVNAGLRMHVPSIVGSQTGAGVGGFSLIAEDGNPLPGLPRVQTEVFMAAGKTYDVMINVPAAGGNALPVYDRELSLSANATQRDAGMLAYIGINGSTIPTASIPALGGAVARADLYNSVIPGRTFTVSDPEKGVIANDTNVYGVAVKTPPTGGVLSLNADGTFTYTSSIGYVTSVNLTSGGSGYPAAPLVKITGGGGSGATATATITNGLITAISSVPDPHTLTLPLAVKIMDTTGSGATASAATDGTTITVTVITQGSNYSSSPTITIVDSTTPTPNTVSGAIATVTNGVVTGLTLKSVGNGYTSAPNVVFSTAAGATAAVATATFAAGSTTSDSFVYHANGNPAIYATVTLGAAPIETAGGITVGNLTYNSNVATFLKIASPGVLSAASDSKGYPLSVNPGSVVMGAGLTLNVDSHGGFTASVSGGGTYYFGYSVKNSQGTASTTSACPSIPGTPVAGCGLVTLNFPTASGLRVKVLDGYDKTTTITDYRWIIEEDKSFYIDPSNTTNNGGSTIVPTFGVNFHTSNMPFVAQGCTGALSCEGGQMIVDATGNHVAAVCDVGDGVCRPDTSGNGFTPVDPASVHLDPTKRYYISVLPGDAANPFGAGYGGAGCSYGSANAPSTAVCGHGMGGAPITFGQTAVTILSQPSPYPTAKLSVFVFEDDFPLNGEHDAGGGIDVIATNEPGLGGFQIHLWDAFGGNGDFTGQMTYDMFNQPLTNSLDGTMDPLTNQNACPITQQGQGITGMIVTCPKYEADGVTLSPLAGQAVVNNLMPGRWGVIATPAADRIARGEEWHQTNTLDGQKAHDSFTRIGEPSYFQEFGPASYHVSVGFANPKIINDRLAGVCSGNDPNLPGSGGCTGTMIKGKVTGVRLSRTPDERLYSSGSRDTFYWTQCYVSVGDPDGEDFAFTKCNPDGTFSLSGIPLGSWRVTTFDQWNDQLVDGLSTPVAVTAANPIVDMGDIAATQWQTNLYTQTFIDDDKTGVSKHPWPNPTTGIPFANVAVRLRDGSIENLLGTDFTGTANFNETFPLFSWYTVETDVTRYKSTGTHVVYDAGGPADGTLTTCGGSLPGTGYPPCGTSAIGKNLANTVEQVSVPNDLRVPGAVYCKVADCTGQSILDPPSNNPSSNCSGSPVTCGAPTLSTGRIDPPWVGIEGWQGFPGQNSFIEFGKAPYAAGENGGIKGHVVYASTRPFDDPMMLVQTQWEPLVPRVTLNLYQEGTAPDGTQSLTLVDHTQTSSFDDWAQGFRADGLTPNMSCPGQSNADLFYFTLSNQPDYLDLYNSQHNGGTPHTLPYNSQFKCYDGMHNWNQVQPAPYDGVYKFPSVTAVDANGKPTTTGTNCTICTPNTAVPATDLYYGIPQLPTAGMKNADGTVASGKYVVEVVLPPGFELVKEEDKNILIGDNFIAPVTQQFGGLGNIFILPDQAQVGSAYNPNNPQNPTQSFGASPLNGIVPGFVPEPIWPCVGEQRVVPDYISLYPQTKQVAPFAGATRNLCDRKEVTLGDQMGAIAKFFIYTSTHIASKFTGGITDDYTSEFDPFSPQFGEKFAPPNMPISVKDWAGNEISRVYSDQWGAYNGMTYSTWEVNPPNPTGYAPTMMVFCMNDPGNGATPDPLFNPAYSQFCYELPFMPGATQYLDTPVVPTSAFAGAGYNNVDCNYPDLTPAIKEVDGHGVGPWVNIPASSVNSLAVANSGSGYNSTFAFNITGDGGTGATGQVTDLKLVSITSFACTTSGVNRCSNFATNPAVTITGGGGSGATATSTKSNTTISFVISFGGSGYTSKPTVTIARLDGTTRTAGGSDVVMGVNEIELTAYGSGYTSTTPIMISGHGGSGFSVAITVSSASDHITITALGDQTVTNYAYSGPSATATPFNQKTIVRHYNFGTAKGRVSIGGVNVPSGSVTWSPTTIVVNAVPANVPLCPVQQQTQYGGSSAFCGELVITAADGKQSVDTVTITIGGKAPAHVRASDTIQSAIDVAMPGDLIIVDPTCNTASGTVACTTAGATTNTNANHNELVLMWKPVRLQGVGAASSIINANAHPAGKLDPWRRQVVCLFGLAINGQPFTATGGTNPYDAPGGFSCPGTGWKGYNAGPNNPQVDRLPREGIVGWDATLNGNLAEQLQEPSLMGAYEGAGITVLSKGVKIPAGSSDFFGSGTEADFPTGTTLLSAADCLDSTGANPYPSNFHCNPSSIDGLGVINSSQGGGGIFVHGWGHSIQIANNRVSNNAGTLGGGINIGQGEFTDAYLAPNSGSIAPGSCQDSPITNTQLPYCFYLNVNVHHNAVTLNSSTGDELFAATPAGAGGVNFCTGADNYKFNYNWVCGNLSTGDGGGMAHMGFSYNGHIEHNTFVFNQSTNPTIPTNGGGLIVMGAPPDGTTTSGPGAGLECGSVTDNDCVPGLGDGAGPGLVINANLFLGNAAESGSGGGLRFQAVNGTDVPRFPANPERWYSALVTNNIIANNVAGWDGAGVSLEDSLAVNLINNTIVSNDTTASAGVLFQTLGAPLASSQSPPGSTNTGNTSNPQPAGLVALHNSPQLTGSFTTGPITCPANHPNCTSISNPYLANDLFWQNRTYYVGVGSQVNSQYQQHIVTLYNSAFNAGAPVAGVQAPSQSATGACTAATYWDIGVRGDTGPGNHSSGFTLAPTFSALTNASEAGSGTNNLLAANPAFTSQYCNGSRVPPENKGMGWQVPPGIADATVPNPIFNLAPTATVDEGNNWVNIQWGPLTLTNPLNGSLLANYAPAAGSPVIDAIPSGSPTYALAPDTDFFGNPRPDQGPIDIGAVEAQNSPPSQAAPTLTSISFTSGVRGTSVVGVVLRGTNFGGLLTTVNAGNGITFNNVTVNSATMITATFVIAPGASLGNHNVTVSTAGGTSNPGTFMVLGAVVSISAPAPLMNGGGLSTKVATITVSNANTATAPLTLTAAPAFERVGGTGTGTFSITGGNCANGAAVNPGSSCTINVQYVPTNTLNATYRVTISGTGDSQVPRNSANFTVN